MLSAAAKGAATSAAKGAATAVEVTAKAAPKVASTVAKASVAGAAAAERGAVALVGEEKVSAAKERAGECAASAATAAKHAASHVEDEARRQAFILLNRGVDRAMPRLSAYAKRQLLDPDMPHAVQRGLDAIVESSMVELREVLTEALTETVLQQPPRDQHKLTAGPPPCCGDACGPCRYARAFVLYHLFPHDRSIWASLRSPWWCLLTLVGVFPLWGVRVAWWTLVFVLKDKRDDFQLCTFVITFKASLFVAGGLQAALLGTVLYTACLEEDSCEHAAPGSAPAGFEFGLLGAGVQAAVCWVAMACLPWAKPKGGRLYELPPAVVKAQARDEAAAAAGTAGARSLARTKGGRLWYWMLYDTFILACCVAGGLVAWYATDEPAHVVRARVYHIRMLYSLLAFPWLLLKLPLAWTLVLHIKPTGYNRRGETVRLCSARERHDARTRRRARAGGGASVAAQADDFGGGEAGDRVQPPKPVAMQTEL